MKNIIIIFSLLLSPSLFALQPYHELSVGYADDLSVSLGIRLEEAGELPFFLQLRGGYVHQQDPGDATLARKIFINDNQGGSIQKYGESYLGALDLGIKFERSSPLIVEFTVSALMNHYRAHFAYVGNNEAFTVKTSPFGLGAGVGLRKPLDNSRSSLLVKGTVEFYPKARIDAHGTYYYTPDGTDDSPRQAYTYEDADGVINQPDFRFSLQVGLLYQIGSVPNH